MVLARASYALIAGVLLQTPELAASFGCPPPERLRRLLQATDNGDAPILLLPCCYDGITARLVGLSGFNATFMTGFGVSGANGYPDTQLVSYNEMLSAANTVADGIGRARRGKGGRKSANRHTVHSRWGHGIRQCNQRQANPVRVCEGWHGGDDDRGSSGTEEMWTRCWEVGCAIRRGREPSSSCMRC